MKEDRMLTGFYILVITTWLLLITLTICGIVAIHKVEKKIEDMIVILTEIECDLNQIEHVEESVEVEQFVSSPEEIVTHEKLYLDTDAIALAKMAWGESRGVVNYGNVSSKCQQAATMWTVLNRYDARYSDSIVGVITAPNQFTGYSDDHPIDDSLLELAYDVLERWNREQHGETNVGRALPSDYFWFHGDGKYNYFRNEFRTSEYYDWSLPDPYV